jgi:UDP-glucose 4-epimerase
MVLKVIAVTGATGMLGRHVKAALVAAEFQVIPCSRRMGSDGGRVWDLSQWKSIPELDELLQGADAVVHMGAEVPNSLSAPDEANMFDANVRACLNLATWARLRGKPLVHLSGGIVYADPGQADITESAPLGWSGLGGFYGMTKLLAEDVLRREEGAGLQLAVLRSSSIYGAGQHSGKMMSIFLASACSGGAIELTEPVDDRVDFIHAADVANAIVRVLRTRSWETFNLASGHLTTVMELAEACVAVAGKGQVNVRTNGNPVQLPSSRFGLNCSRAATRIGWVARIGILEGLRALRDGSVPLVE